MPYLKVQFMNVVFGLNVVSGPVGGYEKEKVNKKEKIPPTPPKKEKINKKEKGETFFLSEGKIDIGLTLLPIRVRVLVPSEPY